MYASLNKLPV